MDIPISDFAKKINFPLCQFMDEFKQWPHNEQKQAINFLSGDPTIYGQQQLQMPAKGYELVKQSIKQEGNHGYIPSTGAPSFREAVMKLYNTNVPLHVSDVHINHGVNMGLLSLFMAFTNQGDEVLVPEIGYPFYHDLCPALGRKAVQYRLNKEKNFEIDLQHVASLITEKTAFMFVINPTNPMGTVFTKSHMKQILAFSDKHEVPLVVDQVYFRMVYPGVEYYSFGEVTQDTPVIVLSGVEKILSVPGWVQSWTVIFDKHKILAQIKKNLEVMATLYLHTNTFIQHAMSKVLSQVGIFTTKNMGAVQDTYKQLFEKIKNISGFRPIEAQGTIYLAVELDFSQFKDIKTDKQFVRLLRAEQNVNIIPLSVMGQLSGIRLVTIGGEAIYKQFFERMVSFVSRHKV